MVGKENWEHEGEGRGAGEDEFEFEEDEVEAEGFSKAEEWTRVREDLVLLVEGRERRTAKLHGR